MKFNIRLADGYCKEIGGTLLKNVPIKCFVHRGIINIYESNNNDWVVSEFSSGCRLTQLYKTRKAAIEAALRLFQSKELKSIEELVNDIIRKYGFANKDESKKSKEGKEDD